MKEKTFLMCCSYRLWCFWNDGSHKSWRAWFKIIVIVLEKKLRPCIKLSITGKARVILQTVPQYKEFADCFHNGKLLCISFNAFSNFDTIF
jgi:hypothetical protein